MNNWIPFAEGEYLAEKILMLAADKNALVVEDATVEVYADSHGQRHLKGRGRIRNVLMVDLLEESDDLDLLLDFGQEFKYRLKEPNLQTGKVFAPDVKSFLQFTPTSPWEQIPEDEFEDLVSRLRILT